MAIRSPACKPNHHGFTLIELLVVISIIGILATIGLAKFASAKARAADATMKSDLNHARVSLEDYKIRMGNYPNNPTQFEANSGFNLSPGVSWVHFNRRMIKMTNDTFVQMVVKHELSENQFEADHPTGLSVTPK